MVPMAKPVLPLKEAPASGEVALLRLLRARGQEVVPTWVVDLEAEFYRLANLPERITALFQGVFGVRIDEERLLVAAEEARRAVRESYLLPERAEAFLEALKGRGPFLLRYAGEAEGERASTPQEALFALKRLWARRFEVEAILERYPALLPPSPPSWSRRWRGRWRRTPSSPWTSPGPWDGRWWPTPGRGSSCG